MKNNIIVCWDLDKTLTDVSWLTDKILNIILQNNWFDYYKDYINKFRAPELEWKPIEYRLKLIFWEELWKNLFLEFTYIKTSENLVPPLFEWIQDILEETSDLVHMIVTNKEEKLANQDIRWNDIEWYFYNIVTSWDTWWDDSKLKPSPFLINHAIKWTDSDTLIMVWDTAADMNSLLWVTHKNKIWFLAWWGNTKTSLNDQNSRINKAKEDSIFIIPSISDMKKILLNYV